MNVPKPLWLRIARLVALAPVAIVALDACARDVFDVDIALSPHAFSGDFGPSMGTIPTVPCDATTAGMCAAGQVLDVSQATAPAEVSVSSGCDATTTRCYAQANARIAYELDVLQDDAFTTKVARDSTSFVHVVDIGYTIPKNTLTFDVPRVDVYVGPAGTKTETDAGVVLIDSLPPIQAGTTFTDEPKHLTLANGSPARTLIESSIQARQPFVLVLVAAPRLEAGSPVPGGSFEIDTYPKIQVGLPD